MTTTTVSTVKFRRFIKEIDNLLGLHRFTTLPFLKDLNSIKCTLLSNRQIEIKDILSLSKIFDEFGCRDRSIDLLARLIHLCPSCSEAIEYKIELCALVGRDYDPKVDLKRACEGARDDCHPYELLAKFLNENNDFAHCMDLANQFSDVLVKSPSFAEQIGIAAYKIGNPDVVLKAYEIVLNDDPSHENALCSLVITYGQIGAWNEAAKCVERLQAISPSKTDIQHVLSAYYLMTSEYKMAALEAENVLKSSSLSSDLYYEARLNLSEAMLGLGQYEQGWHHYEERIRKYNFYPDKNALWHGQDLCGKTLFIWKEQGIGDQIRFASLLPDLIATGARIIVEIVPRLLSLFQRSFPQVEFYTYKDSAERLQKRLKLRFDYHCPMYWPARYIRAVDPFPLRRGLFHPPADDIERMRSYLSGFKGNLKVGIAWRSGNKSIGRSNEVTSVLRDWAEVLQLPGVSFFSLQYDDVSDEITEVADKIGTEIHVPPFNTRDDFNCLASFINQLDLVIGIPIAPVRLAQYCQTEVWDLRHKEPGLCERNFANTSRLIVKPFDRDWSQTFQYIKYALVQKLEMLTPDNVTTDWGLVPRNAPCPCGSDKRYKHCHGA